jgi:hypothetical protein
VWSSWNDITPCSNIQNLLSFFHKTRADKNQNMIALCIAGRLFPNQGFSASVNDWWWRQMVINIKNKEEIELRCNQAMCQHPFGLLVLPPVEEN